MTRDRRLRALLVASAVAFATVAYALLVGSARTSLDRMQDAVDIVGAELAVQEAAAASPWASRISRQQLATLRTVPGVEAVIPMVLGPLRLAGGKPALVLGVELDSRLLRTVAIVDGAPPEAGSGDVLVGADLARRRGIAVGDEVVVAGERSRVAAVFRSGRGLTDSTIAVELARARRQLGVDGGCQFALVDAGGAGAEVAENIRDRLPSLAVEPSEMWVAARSARGVVLAFARSVGIAVALSAALAVAAVLQLAVARRGAEAGVLRALGWRRWRVGVRLLAEPAAVCAAGAIAGALLALAIAAVAAPERLDLAGLAAPLGAVAEGVVLTTLAGVAGAIIPLRHLLATPPSSLLRS